MVCFGQWNPKIEDRLNISGCEIIRSDYFDHIEYVWYVKRNPKNNYKVKIMTYELRNEGDLFNILLVHRERAVDYLLWAGLWDNNAPLASP